ncbi:quinone oxidoreductase family protein [Cytobacillus purgationiresistens]|uniref:NADPH2:quinone reductase n=1 Tax=Cytobacillus purgationiresistens TaxID=863449 RepID=A0ABU0AAR3_9BACI|nr:zinc-binding dehydrogenase [Cytobacillus purgationiresistens]MDQ0268348.1 NADPH2:quinone reductase [Cytobacillus purgationiresistens]
MKAIMVYEHGTADVLSYIDTDIPQITETQVLIKVMKSSVNYADIKTRMGNKDKGNFPFVPGLDTAGVVVRIGKKVTRLKEGDKVIAFPASGSYAEYAAAEEILTYHLPEHLSFTEAAACPTVSFLSYHLLSQIARMDKGETVLIHSAAGGVGSTAVQLAKILGAGKVIGTVGHESKKEIALKAGADYVISRENDEFHEIVNDLTDGKGVNIILDSLAGTTTSDSLLCLAHYGRLIQFGNSSGFAGTIKTSDLHASCRSVLGFSLGTTRKQRPALLLPTAEKVLNLLVEEKLQIQIGEQFSLKEARKAHQLMESRMSTGKILLDISNDLD